MSYSINTCDFTTKEQYLAWRTEWKEAYIELSNEIRQYKRERSTTKWFAQSVAQSHCERLRSRAREMIATRLESKLKAGRHRAENMSKQ